MFSTDPTPYDLRFNLGKIPVRVHWLFWVFSAAFGWNPDHLDATAIWVLAVFLSILVHEWGHAFTAERFGWQSSILMYHFGGLAFYSPYFGRTPFKLMVISAMGPIAGFVLAGISMGSRYLLNMQEIEMPGEIFSFMIFVEYICVYWGFFNLIPVLPLDGGHIMQEGLEIIRIRNPRTVALQATVLIGGAAGFYFFTEGNRWAGIMMIFFAIDAFQELQGGGRR